MLLSLQRGYYSIKDEHFQFIGNTHFTDGYVIQLREIIDIYDRNDCEGLGIVINYTEKRIYFTHSSLAVRLDIFCDLTANLNKFMADILVDNSEEEYVVLVKECMRVLSSLITFANNFPVGDNRIVKRAI